MKQGENAYDLICFKKELLYDTDRTKDFWTHINQNYSRETEPRTLRDLRYKWEDYLGKLEKEEKMLRRISILVSDDSSSTSPRNNSGCNLFNPLFDTGELPDILDLDDLECED